MQTMCPCTHYWANPYYKDHQKPCSLQVTVMEIESDKEALSQVETLEILTGNWKRQDISSANGYGTSPYMVMVLVENIVLPVEDQQRFLNFQ